MSNSNNNCEVVFGPSGVQLSITEKSFSDLKSRATLDRIEIAF